MPVLACLERAPGRPGTAMGDRGRGRPGCTLDRPPTTSSPARELAAQIDAERARRGCSACVTASYDIAQGTPAHGRRGNDLARRRAVQPACAPGSVPRRWARTSVPTGATGDRVAPDVHGQRRPPGRHARSEVTAMGIGLTVATASCTPPRTSCSRRHLHLDPLRPEPAPAPRAMAAAAPAAPPEPRGHRGFGDGRSTGGRDPRRSDRRGRPIARRPRRRLPEARLATAARPVPVEPPPAPAISSPSLLPWPSPTGCRRLECTRGPTVGRPAGPPARRAG